MAIEGPLKISDILILRIWLQQINKFRRNFVYGHEKVESAIYTAKNGQKIILTPIWRDHETIDPALTDEIGSMWILKLIWFLKCEFETALEHITKTRNFKYAYLDWI